MRLLNSCLLAPRRDGPSLAEVHEHACHAESPVLLHLAPRQPRYVTTEELLLVDGLEILTRRRRIPVRAEPVTQTERQVDDANGPRVLGNDPIDRRYRGGVQDPWRRQHLEEQGAGHRKRERTSTA